MRPEQAEAFWQAFRRHQGLNSAQYQATHFRTAPEVADRQLDGMLAGAVRAATGPLFFFENGRYETMPPPGDHVVFLDSRQRPRLIWRTTNASVAPLSSVTDGFVWRNGLGNGDRAEWLRLHRAEYARQGRIYGFESHDDVETVFVSFEVVWPEKAARRIQLVASHLDRGIALLQSANEQRSVTEGLEAILARIQTAVLTVTPTLRLGFSNPAAEAILMRGDGLLVRNGRLAARRHTDDHSLLATVSEICGPRTELVTSPQPGREPGSAVLVPIFRGENRPPYQASIFPLRRGHAVSGLTSEASAVLFVDDPDDRGPPAEANLYSRAFKLTPAEARLAVHLVSGASLTEAADEFGVTHNTVRAQLRAIFDKTDTHRQADLVRLLHKSGSLRVSLS
jgi:DNA-binding CsgD family transcriptional regulator/uncharacterized protein YhfF